MAVTGHEDAAAWVREAVADRQAEIDAVIAAQERERLAGAFRARVGQGDWLNGELSRFGLVEPWAFGVVRWSVEPGLIAKKGWRAEFPHRDGWVQVLLVPGCGWYGQRALPAGNVELVELVAPADLLALLEAPLPAQIVGPALVGLVKLRLGA